jgi:hypothetical protein
MRSTTWCVVEAVLMLALAQTRALCEGNTGGPANPPEAKITLTLQVSPEATFRRRPLQLTCVLETGQTLTSSNLVLSLPPGLRVASVSRSVSGAPAKPLAPIVDSSAGVTTPIPSFSGRVSFSYLLMGTGADVVPGSYPLNVLVTRPDTVGAATSLASGSIALTVRPEQRLVSYLGVGAVGIVLGYLLRLVIKALSSTTPPVPVNQTGGQPGPITRFVANHYYPIDCAVTLVLGLAAMLVLVKDAHLPDNAANWYGAGLLGLGLGLLTNSELITKVR